MPPSARTPFTSSCGDPARRRNPWRPDPQWLPGYSARSGCLMMAPSSGTAPPARQEARAASGERSNTSLLVANGSLQTLIQRKAVACQADRRLQASLQGQLAVLARQVSNAAGSPGIAADNAPSIDAFVDGVAGLIQVHVARCGARGLLPRIEHGLEAVGLTMQQIKPPPPRPELLGSTTASAADTATAASKALPPAARISCPAWLARG